MIGISRKDILKYSLLPQVVPRAKEMFGSGLYYVAYFIALVYSAVRLLPDNHPYVSAGNIGRFGVRHVIAEAANHIQIDRHNIDKVVLFFLVLLGLAIGFVQIILLVGSLFVQTAWAQGVLNFSDYFVTQNPKDDLAYMFMDMVFGIPDLFHSCIQDTDATSTPCVGVDGSALNSLTALASYGFPYPIHHALHQMLSLYSTGLMIIGVLITCYFIFTVLAETAQTGTPFGKRFNKVWAPLRLVAAFALLMPIAHGMNGAQYIVLNMAKFGSSFATNGWVKFNETLDSQYESAHESLVARPQSPEVVSLLQFLFTAKACTEMENVGVIGSSTVPDQVHPYLVRTGLVSGTDHVQLTWNETQALPEVTYKRMYNFINGGNGSEDPPAEYGADHALIVFGRTGGADKYKKYEGKIEPVCGTIRFPLTDLRQPYPFGSGTGDTGTYQRIDGHAEPGIDLLQRYYWDVVQRIYFSSEYLTHKGTDGAYYDTAKELVKKVYSNEDAQYPVPTTPDAAYMFPADALNYFATDLKYVLSAGCTAEEGYDGSFDTVGSCGYLDGVFFTPYTLPHHSMVYLQNQSETWAVSEELKQKGWAAAGIWYNKLAEMNGTVISSALNIPQAARYPVLMEEVVKQKRIYNQHLDIETRFNPANLANGQKIDLNDEEISDMVVGNRLQKAVTLWTAYALWNEVGTNPYNQPTGNAFVDAIKAIFGTEGLYNMQHNKDTHPLSQLIGVGKSLIESSVRNVGYAAIGSGSKILMRSLGLESGTAFANAFVGFVVSITTIAMTMGFLLYYVVPFLPFIYFFFAVGGWVKGIFEALVGVPLWALAHIRIDGNGLPGQAALNGYFLILEIFVRPILTVFGLLASIAIFSALVGVLGDIWVMVTSNVAGFDVRTSISGVYLSGQEQGGNFLAFMRSEIDQFFYTVVYAIVVYMIGMSSFKLIDMIPNNILRWMGQNVSSFNDTRENPAQSTMGAAYFGANQVTEKVGSLF